MTASSFLSVLSGHRIDPPPIWLMRQAGRYLPEYRATRAAAGSFLDLCFTPTLAAEVTLQPIDRFGFDAAILFSDILVAPWAMGREVRFVEGEGPVLSPIASAAEMEALEVDDAVSRLSTVLEAIRLIKARLPSDTPLIGFAGAPWTLATYMFGGKGSVDQAPPKLMALREPEIFWGVMAKLEAVIGDFLIAQIDAGVDAVKLFDSWAGATWPSLREAAVDAPLTRLTARLRAERPETPVILFPRGVGPAAAAIDAAAEPACIALDTGLDPAWVSGAMRPGAAVQGNLDPVFLRGPVDAMRAELDRIRAGFKDRPHILNLGHGVTPDTRIENVQALIAHWRAV